ncbi:ATPase [Beggiatoa sp. PS]|nr:ATPase [Beggiatoa sp. PS]
MLFSRLESTFICQYNPDILTKLANFEWFIQYDKNDNHLYRHHHTEVEECFGLHKYKYEFFPASGEKGPFRNLLDFHPRKGLDFILKLLNNTAKKYAHSNLDAKIKSGSYFKIDYSEPLIPQIAIQLNDGSCIIKQYCSERLWIAYRGHSVAPYLLQCALMALENWLIAYTEISESEDLEWLFDYILRNSNSVMPTAVLASVAVGFPEKAGRFVLPLLQIPELYSIDLHRTIQEMGKYETNWFYAKSNYQNDPLFEFYAEERKTAALRPWRKEHLETLVVRLQFSQWREQALAAIEKLRASVSNGETERFLLHRIDSRGWNPVEDKENNRILFEPKELEPDLKEIQLSVQDDSQIRSRFTALLLWAKNTFERKPLERDYYPTWNDALIETKALLDQLNNGASSELVMFYESIIIAVAVFMRDHSNKLTEEDIEWCAEIIFPLIIENADNSLAITNSMFF